MAARIASVSSLLKTASEERGFLDEWENGFQSTAPE